MLTNYVISMKREELQWFLKFKRPKEYYYPGDIHEGELDCLSFKYYTENGPRLTLLWPIYDKSDDTNYHIICFL